MSNIRSFFISIFPFPRITRSFSSSWGCFLTAARQKGRDKRAKIDRRIRLTCKVVVNTATENQVSVTASSFCFLMSHELLLRLFLSPSFFSVHVALQYLRLYSDSIGITYYLTRRLRELDTGELKEVWGFIWRVTIVLGRKFHQ